MSASGAAGFPGTPRAQTADGQRPQGRHFIRSMGPRSAQIVGPDGSTSEVPAAHMPPGSQPGTFLDEQAFVNGHRQRQAAQANPFMQQLVGPGDAANQPGPQAPSAIGATPLPPPVASAPATAPTLAQFTPAVTSKVEPFGMGTRTMYYVDGVKGGFTDLNSAKTFASQQIGRIALEKALYPGGGGLGPIGTNSPSQINDAYAQFRINAKAAYEANPNAQTLATYQTSLNSAYDPQATTVTDPAIATQLYGAGNYHQNADGTYEAGAVGANGVTDAQALAASDAYTQQILAAVHGGGVSPWVANPQPTPTSPPTTPSPAITPAGLTPTAAAAAAAQKARSQGQFPATTATTPAAGPSMETPGFSGSAGPSMEVGRPTYATPAVSQNPPTQPPPASTVGPGASSTPSYAPPVQPQISTVTQPNLAAFQSQVANAGNSSGAQISPSGNTKKALDSITKPQF